MSVIFCGKNNKTGYYIKEADMNIYSIQELSYFIYNYAMLITNSFVSKNLIYYINKDLEMNELSNKLNILCCLQVLLSANNLSRKLLNLFPPQSAKFFSKLRAKKYTQQKKLAFAKVY